MSVKNNQVQFLRGITCLMIVFFHYYCRYEQIYLNNYQHSLLVSKMGVIGVLLFLLISGYYLVPNKKINCMKYISSRMYKLYPPYFISIIIIYLSSFSGYLGANREVSLVDFFKNLIMVNGFIDSPYVDGAHWYITYTIIFILIVALFILFKKQDDINYYMIWLLINVILCILSNITDNLIIEKLKLLSGGVYTPFIIIGIIIRQIKKNNFTINKIILLLSLSFLSILLTSGVFYFLLAIVLSYVLWSVVNNKINIFNEYTWIISIGNMSYVIYLIHQNIGYMLLNYFNNKFDINNILLVCIVSAIVITISWLIKYICDILLYDKKVRLVKSYN